MNSNKSKKDLKKQAAELNKILQAPRVAFVNEKGLTSYLPEPIYEMWRRDHPEKNS